MNERNVAALADLIQAYIDAPAESPMVTCIVVHPARDLAEALAARGVLVPAALTDEEARDIATVGDEFSGEVPEQREHLTAALERIAKGEPD